MKTILAFFFSILLMTMSGYFLTLAPEAFLASNQTYLGQQTNDVYNFRLILLFAGLIVILLSIVCAVTSIICMLIFRTNYLRILQRRRDEHIKRELLNAKYDKLYEALNNTNIYEEKEEIVKDFYKDTQIEGIKSLLKNILKNKERDNAMKAKSPFPNDLDISGLTN